MKRIGKIKNAKKIILPSTFLVVSFYLPIFFLIGIVFGYWGTNKFCKKYIDSGIVNPIYINFGEWELHLHHWLTGSFAFLFFSFLNSFYYSVPHLFFGALGGIIVHDFYTDKVWHKVIYKKDNGL